MKILFRMSCILLGLNLVTIIVPFMIAFIFPNSEFMQVGWIFPFLGLFTLPVVLILFFICLAIPLKKSEKEQR